MDAKRIEAIEKHLAADAGQNVALTITDFCALVQASGTTDPGFVKSAKSLVVAVGFLAIDRVKAAELLAASKPRQEVRSQKSEARSQDPEAGSRKSGQG